MDSVIVRHAADRDIEVLTDLYKEFHEFHVKGLPDRLQSPLTYVDEGMRSKLAGILEAEGSTIFVAEFDGRVIGLAEVYLKEDEANPFKVLHTYAHLQSMMVTGNHRRQKVGRKLLLAVERWAKERGASEIRLDIWEFEAGPLEFYEKQGYRTLRRTMVRKL